MYAYSVYVCCVTVVCVSAVKLYFFSSRERIPLQVVVADPLKGLVVDRILAVLEAHRRVELFELSPDERGSIGGGGGLAVGLIRCTVAVTNAT